MVERLVVSGATDGLIPAIRDLGVPVLEEQNHQLCLGLHQEKHHIIYMQIQS